MDNQHSFYYEECTKEKQEVIDEVLSLLSNYSCAEIKSILFVAGKEMLHKSKMIKVES